MQSEIGERLRAVRKKLGLSQTEMANLGGIGLGTQGRWEAGGGLPSTEYLLAVGEAGADWFWILTGRPNTDTLSEDAAELLNRYLTLPPTFREPLLLYVRSFTDALNRMPGGQPPQEDD